jgi:hypothetical protein
MDKDLETENTKMPGLTIVPGHVRRYRRWCRSPRLGASRRAERLGALMEELRAIIGASLVLSLINNGSLVRSDFLIWNDACRSTAEGRETFSRAYKQMNNGSSGFCARPG